MFFELKFYSQLRRSFYILLKIQIVSCHICSPQLTYQKMLPERVLYIFSQTQLLRRPFNTCFGFPVLMELSVVVFYAINSGFRACTNPVPPSHWNITLFSHLKFYRLLNSLNYTVCLKIRTFSCHPTAYISEVVVRVCMLHFSANLIIFRHLF